MSSEDGLAFNTIVKRGCLPRVAGKGSGTSRFKATCRQYAGQHLLRARWIIHPGWFNRVIAIGDLQKSQNEDMNHERQFQRACDPDCAFNLFQKGLT